MANSRSIGWFSCGAASAVAIKLALRRTPKLIPVYCETGSEHADNDRFFRDCEQWFGTKIVRIRSQVYADTWDVWQKRRYLSGVYGAPCTVELKISPRLEFQRPSDKHVFGYTADLADIKRAHRLRSNYPELAVKTPLIERAISKEACFEMLSRAGIRLPTMYHLGFRNNNCVPCVKATSPTYWAMVRKNFPDDFDRLAKLSRELGARLCLIKKKRAFIDEIPLDHPTNAPISVSCDFLCGLARSHS